MTRKQTEVTMSLYGENKKDLLLEFPIDGPVFCKFYVDAKEVGGLTYVDGKFRFYGDADASVEQFVNALDAQLHAFFARYKRLSE